MSEAKILSLEVTVPHRIVTNEDMARIVDTSDEWIHSHTGIRQRHHVDPDQATSDLGTIAGRKALESAGVSPESVDLVICATSTSDYINFPATACIIQDALGLENAGAFDLLAGCTGFVYGLETARAYIESGLAGTVLLVGAEVLSKLSNMQDRNTCVLFGDGAGALVLTGSDHGGDARPTILGSWLRSKGSGAGALMRRAGGTRNPYVHGQTDPTDLLIEMNGRDVYMFAVDAIVRTITTLAEKTGVSLEQVTRIVPHQANERIIEAAAKRLKLPKEKFFINIERYANTSAASIPLAMNQMVEEGTLNHGDTIITVGFGAGLTYGGNVIAW